MKSRYEIVLPGAPGLDPHFLRTCAGDVNADIAIYVGIAGISARPSACAFDVPEVADYVRKATAEGVRVLAAMNAELNDGHVHRLPAIAARLKDAGVSAFVVSDLPAIELLCRAGLPVHVSSLLPAYNTAALSILRDMGVERLVLSTSLSWRQIVVLATSELLELELIAAGGVCYNDCTRCGLPHDMDDNGLIVGCKQSVMDSGRVRPLWLPHGDPERIVHKAHASGIRCFKVEGRSESRDVIKARIRGLVAAINGSPEIGDPQKGPGLYEH